MSRYIDTIWRERARMEPWKNSSRLGHWQARSDLAFMAGLDWRELTVHRPVIYVAAQQPLRRRKMTRAEAVMTAALAAALLAGTAALFLRLLIMPG